VINNILTYLKKSSRQYPNKVCIGDRSGTYTFRQLEQQAMTIGMAVMQTLSRQYRQPIPVFMEKSIDAVASFLGIVFSGNHYVPLDIQSPEKRLKQIVETLNAPCIVTDEKHISHLKEVGLTIPLLSIDSLEEIEIVPNTTFEDQQRRIISSDPLYVLFTSGTTGIPKGVVITHRSVIDYTEWLSDTFYFSETTVFANQAPFYFDNSILDIYSTLKHGGTLWLVPEEKYMFPQQLLTYLTEKNVNTIFWVPSALTLVANSGIFKSYSADALPPLEKILFCGEVMHNKPLNSWRAAFPSALYANLYGPTEITDVCCYYIIDRPFNDNESLPIGAACENTEILVLNSENRPVQDDEIGELCVRGESLSLGYYGDAQKTNAVFVQNPLNNSYRDLIYRTGDLVRYNQKNELIFMGRKDYQIKHMGHRIELGEIESMAASLSLISTCCALYNEAEQKIILVCVCSGPGDEKEIYMSLKDLLPIYMVPQRIIITDALPLNANGKIDRKKVQQELIIGEAP